MYPRVPDGRAQASPRVCEGHTPCRSKLGAALARRASVPTPVRRSESFRMQAEASTSNGASAQSKAQGEQFVRPHLRKLAPYTPIEPFEVLSARLGRTPDQIIKLDANENPYGPPPEVRTALASMPFPHIYPDPETRRLRQALATENEISAEHLLVGCGADELIDLIMRCCLEPGDSIVDCPPTFTMYAFDAAVNNAEVISVPRLEGFGIDVKGSLAAEETSFLATGVEAAVRDHGAKIVFLTSPNNPDGSMVSEGDLLAILGLPALVVLDEAYIEFSTEKSRMRWVERFPNLIVLRTFSKSAALAGIRVGYGAFPLAIAAYIWRAKQPYNVSVASETAACAALMNPAYLQQCCEALKAERDRMYRELQSISFLRPHPSHSNFVLCNVVGRDARAVKDALARDYGIMIRHYAKPELSGFVRISAGKPAHTDALLAALRELDASPAPSTPAALSV